MDGSERTHRAGRRRDLAVAVVAAVVVVVAMYGAARAERTQDDLEVRFACQAKVNAELRAGAAIIRESDTEQMRAQLELVTTPPGDREAGRAAVGRFAGQLREAIASREANPLPTRQC